MKRNRQRRNDPNQMILPFDSAPSYPHTSPALQHLVEKVYEKHGWDYVVKTETRPTQICSQFELPRVGPVLVSTFPSNLQDSLYICAFCDRNIPASLHTEIAQLLVATGECPEGCAKLLPNGNLALMEHQWLPRKLTVEEVDHVFHPALHSLLHKVNQTFPKVHELLTRRWRKLPPDQDTGLIF